jgi:hypothetical protein
MLIMMPTCQRMLPEMKLYVVFLHSYHAATGLLRLAAAHLLGHDVHDDTAETHTASRCAASAAAATS